MECPECNGELFHVQEVVQYFTVEGVGVDGTVDLGELADEYWDENKPIKIRCEDCGEEWTPRELAIEALEDQDDRYN